MKKSAQIVLKLACGWVCFCGGAQAWAAYRVYKLEVNAFDERNRPLKKQTVLSTLDPLQYENYHGGYGRAVIKLVDSWFCPGDTSRQGYCSKPKDRKALREPAGLTAPKRMAP